MGGLANVLAASPLLDFAKARWSWCQPGYSKPDYKTTGLLQSSFLASEVAGKCCCKDLPISVMA